MKHTLFILAATLLVLAVLFALPAQAQDTEPPISSTASSTLYLPAVARLWHAWFTDAELDAAMIAGGYDVQVASMHTNCILDVTSVVPYLIRYTSCNQYYVRGVPTEGTDHYIWYIRMSDGAVTGLEVGQ